MLMRERRDWQSYIEALAARMRLGHWTFKIDEESPGGEHTVASVEPWPGRFVATIWLSDRFLDASPEDQRYSIVHELTHCYFAHANSLIVNDLSNADERAWRKAHEYGVDQVATVIAQTMPLPNSVPLNDLDRLNTVEAYMRSKREKRSQNAVATDP